MVPTIASENDDTVAQQRPMSVERIVEEAQNFEYNPLIPLKYWLRTASTLLKEVGYLPAN
jgi:STAM-binding protein